MNISIRLIYILYIKFQATSRIQSSLAVKTRLIFFNSYQVNSFSKYFQMLIFCQKKNKD